MQKRDFPWYEIVDDKEPVLQGDFLLSCPVFIPTTESLFNEDESPAGNIDEYDVIVMSQSCDLAFKKLNLVLVCPIWSLSDLEKENNYFKKREGKETLRQGNVPGYHLLNVCDIEGFRREYKAAPALQGTSFTSICQIFHEGWIAY